MRDKVAVKAYSGGAGRKVHAGARFEAAQVDCDDLRGGRGIVALCGVYERAGGSWFAAETSAPVDCPDCAEMLAKLGIVHAAVPTVALKTEVWGALGSALLLHSKWQE